MKGILQRVDSSDLHSMGTFGYLIGMILAAQSPARDRFGPAYVENLSHWREQFENVLTAPAEYDGYVDVQSEELGGAHADALYPVGSAFERYVIFFNEGDDGDLMYQRRHGSVAKVDWLVHLISAKKHRPTHGTVRAYLGKLGMAISPKAQLTPKMKRQLSATGYFANFSYHPEMGGYFNVVRPDGSQTKTVRNPHRFFTTPNEVALIRSRVYAHP